MSPERESPNMLSVFRYELASQFLKDAWLEKKSKNPGFSLRAWASHLGFKSHASLNKVLNGQRSIPKSYLPKMADSLGLTSPECFYLETLINLEHSKKFEEKVFYRERLRQMSPKSTLNFKEVESYRFLKDPIHALILEMTSLKDFAPDPEWIQSRLAFKRSAAEITEAIDRLFALGLLQKDPNGKVSKTNENLSNIPDVRNEGVQEYHKNVSRLAIELIEKQDPEEREFNGYSISIDPSRMKRAKQLIREFITAFSNELEAAPGQATATYQLNVQFFGLTTNHREKFALRRPQTEGLHLKFDHTPDKAP